MPLIISILAGFLPMFFFAAIMYRFDRFEKEPGILLVSVFLWGAFVAALGAFLVNTIFGVVVFAITESESASTAATVTFSAPIIEESLKGLAVLIVFLRFRREFDSVLDGILYASITALGFAATENAYYIYAMGYAESGYSGILGMFFLRVVLVGWQHPFYTSFIGIGLALARLTKQSVGRAFYPLLGWLAAVSAHAIHNSLVSNENTFFTGIGLDWLGWFLMLLFILAAQRKELALMKQYLASEVETGILSPEQFQMVTDFWSRTKHKVSAKSTIEQKQMKLMLQLSAELAHKKSQLERYGEETGNSKEIEILRSKLKEFGANPATW